MFAFDADCADCRSLHLDDEYRGKFYCEKKKDYVSARANICRMAAETMGRATSDKNKARRTSKDHGYYVVTAISEILGLPEDNEYMCAFTYLRDVILPSDEEYKGFIDDYEVDGPALATLLKDDENAQDYAEYLRGTYLNGVVRLFCQNQIDDAIALYTSMLDAMKERYGYQRQDVKGEKAVMYAYV
ncbi:MAG: hypothetical protein K2G03_07105 [Bacilli bacterium]|nr:hypothetical protein [Bacilli bacterium]